MQRALFSEKKGEFQLIFNNTERWFSRENLDMKMQTLATSAILSFIEKAFDQIYWRKSMFSMLVPRSTQ